MFWSLQCGSLEAKLHNGHLSTQEQHHLLKQELIRRDETIEELRREVLQLQEKRDQVQAEVSILSLVARHGYFGGGISFVMKIYVSWSKMTHFCSLLRKQFNFVVDGVQKNDDWIEASCERRWPGIRRWEIYICLCIPWCTSKQVE